MDECITLESESDSAARAATASLHGARSGRCGREHDVRGRQEARSSRSVLQQLHRRLHGRTARVE